MRKWEVILVKITNVSRINLSFAVKSMESFTEILLASGKSVFVLSFEETPTIRTLKKELLNIEEV